MKHYVKYNFEIHNSSLIYKMVNYLKNSLILIKLYAFKRVIATTLKNVRKFIKKEV
jgi:hypothetical protein